jgi:MYXO-CTERM domain-containing protein
MILFAAGEALACGGFFCNANEPVEQTGETIVFEVEDKTVTTHVVVQYTGTAQDFAWVLPAPGIPEVFLSSEALFDTLQVRTEPIVSLRRTTDCEYDDDAFMDASSGGSTTLITSSSSPDSGTVQVLATPEVGPYVGVVLSASDEQALVGWLQDNGFAIPDSFAAAAAPYLEGGMNFLALKLNKTADLGDLPPLGVKWAGTRPSVPLTLTAVAAQPNLPLTVYVLGEHRAVPLSYLHVQMNPLVYDWFGRGFNWLERVGRAADEAGGRAFATTYAGPTGGSSLGCQFMNVDGLDTLDVALDWFLALGSHGFAGTPELLEILRVHVPAPQGVDEIDFYNRPYDYAAQWAALDATFDPVAATADLSSNLVQPCLDAEEILARSPYLTRLTSTVSPEEMTVDPEFGFNPDLPNVSNYLEADLHDNCDGTGVLTLPGGFVLPIASLDDTYPDAEWVDSRLDHHALIIEQLSESGSGEVLVDYTDELVGDLLDVAKTCGCSSGAAMPAGALLLALLVPLRRRR